MKSMKIAINIALCGAAAFALSSCVTKQSQDKNAPVGPPSASLTFKGNDAAYWISGGGGKGTLSYNGQSHSFSVKGVGFGGTGMKKVSTFGTVYNLTQLADFPGKYTGKRSGFTLYKGKQHAKLTNDKGVVIYVESQTKGLASSAGVITVMIDLN